VFVSLNEIDVSAKRAARGIGMSWGLAEETGRAARFLCARRLPGIDVLVPLLRAEDGAPAAKLAPLTGGGEWRARGSFVCPIMTGAALADDGARAVSHTAIRLKTVHSPLFLVPFLAGLARQQGRAVRCQWPDADVLCGTDGEVAVSGDLRAAAPVSVDIAFGLQQFAGEIVHEVLEPVDVEDGLWRDLQALAARTYVPASEHSRLAGAGAGLSDND
jgi:hypothetical protein